MVRTLPHPFPAIPQGYGARVAQSHAAIRATEPLRRKLGAKYRAQLLAVAQPHRQAKAGAAAGHRADLVRGDVRFACARSEYGLALRAPRDRRMAMYGMFMLASSAFFGMFGGRK